MKCFYDPTQDAVGTCKSCGKGLSPEYLVDMGKGLACKGRCEKDVKLLIAVIEQNISNSPVTTQILKRNAKSAYGIGLFFILIGLIFGYQAFQNPDFSFARYFGLIFLIFGAWYFIRAYRYSTIVAKLSVEKTEE